MNPKDAPKGYIARKQTRWNKTGCDPRCAFITRTRRVDGCDMNDRCSLACRKDRTPVYFEKLEQSQDEMTRKLKRGTLKSILEAINGLDGLNYGSASMSARMALAEFSYRVRDERLEDYDRVFKSAGWDDQGFRLNALGVVELVEL